MTAYYRVPMWVTVIARDAQHAREIGHREIPARLNLRRYSPAPELPILPASLDPYETAWRIWTEATSKMALAVEDRIRGRARALFPDAAKLTGFGVYNEDGLLRLSAVAVFDAAGLPLAEDTDFPEPEHEEALAKLEELNAEGHLDFLGELTGEDYLGEFEIDLTQKGEHDGEVE